MKDPFEISADEATSAEITKIEARTRVLREELLTISLQVKDDKRRLAACKYNAPAEWLDQIANNERQEAYLKLEHQRLIDEKCEVMRRHKGFVIDKANNQNKSDERLFVDAAHQIVGDEVVASIWKRVKELR